MSEIDMNRLLSRFDEVDKLGELWTRQRHQLWRDVGDEMMRSRKGSGMSMRQLGDKMGCSAPFLSDMEKGNRKYSIPWIKEAVKHLTTNQRSGTTT